MSECVYVYVCCVRVRAPSSNGSSCAHTVCHPQFRKSIRAIELIGQRSGELGANIEPHTHGMLVVNAAQQCRVTAGQGPERTTRTRRPSHQGQGGFHPARVLSPEHDSGLGKPKQNAVRGRRNEARTAFVLWALPLVRRQPSGSQKAPSVTSTPQAAARETPVAVPWMSQ